MPLRALLQSWRAVHPRVCGEHPYAEHRGRDLLGSSPRMRGTSRHPCYHGVVLRFIPAYARNIQNRRSCSSLQAVHPRVCGEHLHLVHEVGRGYGSSPRMRGTFSAVDLTTGGLRFIPAYAGNILCRRLDDRRPSVHPRVCGEHSL